MKGGALARCADRGIEGNARLVKMEVSMKHLRHREMNRRLAEIDERIFGTAVPVRSRAIRPRKTAIVLLTLAVVGLMALSASVALANITTTINPANAPSGTHLQSGAIGCTVGGDLSVTCSAFELAGVGNTNADVSLTANYSATIDCTNHGGNLVESHTASFSASDSATAVSRKNGRMAVPGQSASPFAAPQVCPNPNWTPSIREGTLTLNSFTYTLTFAGFTGAYITITGP